MTKSAGNPWSQVRFQPDKKAEELEQPEHRTPHEQDYDRLLFSTAVRRLSDKTQVFPLDDNDGVRTRLTHSHEVSNIARSIGLRAVNQDDKVFRGADFHRSVSPLLAAAGLSHDLGNPPFGHQGEAAISEWFGTRKDWIFDRHNSSCQSSVDPVGDHLRREFLSFDGNPQSLRLMTRLQTSRGRVGLDLTAGAIMAAMKYPVGAANVQSDHPVYKKFGYFYSEADIVDWAREQTGLKERQRHPVAWITEAADDTAYSVLDVEDSMKKGILSPDDLLTILEAHDGLKDHIAVKKMRIKFGEVDSEDRSPSVRRDIKIGYARSYLIHDLIIHATNEFLSSSEEIWKYTHGTPLMDSSTLCNELKAIAREYAFGNKEVLYTEALGRAAIGELLDWMWDAITRRRKESDLKSRRDGAVDSYVYSLISSNYIEAAEVDKKQKPEALRLRYRELRLLSDMISGMTDHFAIEIHKKIKSLQ